MKKLVSTIWLLFALQSSLLAEPQRMSVSAAQLNGLELPASGFPVDIIGHCLDPGLDMPNASDHLDHVLGQTDQVMVQFEGSQKVVPLSSLLGKPNGIDVTGVPITEYLMEGLRGHSDRGSSDGFKLKLINGTGQRLKLLTRGDVQLGCNPGEAVNTHGAITQLETWANICLDKLRDLHYIEESERRRILQSPRDEKVRQAEELVIRFESENEISAGEVPFISFAESAPFADPDAYLRKRRLKIRAEYIVKLKRDRDLHDAFSGNDIGIPGNNPDEWLSNYRKASENATLTDDEVITKVLSDKAEHVYYLHFEETDKYIPYLRSSFNKNLLYTNTEYAKRYMKQLEEQLFTQPINEDNIHILNFLSPEEKGIESTFKTLQDLFPNNHSNYSLSALAALKKVVREKKIKYLLCLGHFENDRIFTKIGDNKVSFDMDELHKLAMDLGVYLIPIGCHSSFAGGGGTGTLKAVNSVKVLNQIFEGLSAGGSVGDFLTTFIGNNQSGYSFVWEFEENTRVMHLRVYEKERKEWTRPEENEEGSGKKRGNGPSGYSFTSNSPAFTVPIFRQVSLAIIGFINQTSTNGNANDGNHRTGQVPQ